MKKRPLVIIIVIILLLIVIGFFGYKYFTEKNNNSTQFQLSKKDKNIIWHQDISELNLQESAIPEWRARIEKLSKEIENVESDVDKRVGRY